MGAIKVDLQVWSQDGTRSAVIRDITVDTGASFTRIPGALLADLGVSPTDKGQAELADGRTIEYDIGEARVQIDGRSAVTPVLFGHEGEKPLIGVVTLEETRFIADPVNHRLAPVERLLI